MTNEPYELNPEFPHKVLQDHPAEIHISPRTAYFVQDGKVMALRLEELTSQDIAVADAKLAKLGVDTSK